MCRLDDIVLRRCQRERGRSLAFVGFRNRQAHQVCSVVESELVVQACQLLLRRTIKPGSRRKPPGKACSMQGLFRYRNNYIDAFLPDDRLQGIEVGRRIGIGRRHPDRFGHAAGCPADMQSERVCHDHAGTSLMQGAREF